MAIWPTHRRRRNDQERRRRWEAARRKRERAELVRSKVKDASQ